MASAIIAVSGQTDKAARIVADRTAAPLAAQPGSFAVIDRAGSGTAHIATLDSCDCRDFHYRGQKRPCKHIVAVRRMAGIVVCPECGSRTRREGHYVGGRGGVCTFHVCEADRSHRALPAD